MNEEHVPFMIILYKINGIYGYSYLTAAVALTTSRVTPGCKTRHPPYRNCNCLLLTYVCSHSSTDTTDDDVLNVKHIGSSNSLASSPSFLPSSCGRTSNPGEEGRAHGVPLSCSRPRSGEVRSTREQLRSSVGDMTGDVMDTQLTASDISVEVELRTVLMSASALVGDVPGSVDGATSSRRFYQVCRVRLC